MDIQIEPWRSQSPTSLRTTECVEVLNLHQSDRGIVFILPTGEKLQVTSKGEGFQCRYLGDAEGKTFDAGVFTFENGFPHPPSVEKPEE